MEIETQTSAPDWKIGIALASQYIEERGWKVVFSFTKDSMAEFAKKKITVNSRHPLKIRYYVLLHEIGHAIDMDSIFYSSVRERAGPRYNTLAYRVETVRSEFEAWDKGKLLALTNNWPMDKTYLDIQAKFLSKYMDWVNNRKNKKVKK